MTCSQFIVRPDDKLKGKSVHPGEKREVRCKAFEGGASIRMTIDAFGGENPFQRIKKAADFLSAAFQCIIDVLAFIAVS